MPFCLCGRWPACLDDPLYPCIPYDEPLSEAEGAALLGFDSVEAYREWERRRQAAKRGHKFTRPVPDRAPGDRERTTEG